MVTPWDKPLYWSLGDLSIKTHGGERPSVVASWIGRPVLDEVLPPSDRGERSETFSLRRRGVPQGDCQGGCPLGWLSGDSFSIERVTLGVRGAERPRRNPGRCGGRSASTSREGRAEPGHGRGRRSRPQSRLAETTGSHPPA